MLKYLTQKLRTQSINDENHANEKIDGHDSGTESDGDLEQEDDLIQEHEMELSLSSRQDTASPTDTACSSESPAFLGPSSSHLLLYDQNSSEEELEVINGGAGSCDIEVGSVSGVPSRIGDASGVGVIHGGIGIAVIDPHGGTSVDEDDDEDDRTEEILADGEDDEEPDEDEEDEDDAEEDDDYREAPGTASRSTPTAMATATTIIGSAVGAMDTSSSNSSSTIRGQFVPVGGGAAGDEVSQEGMFGRSESVDDFSDELSALTGKVSSVPAAVNKLNSTSGKRFTSVGSLLEKRKRSLAHNSDDEVRYLLEQQQQLQTPLQSHHQHSHQHHHHHHHHTALRQQHPHQPEQHPEDALLSAPVNFRTSPPLEALKPHRGHIIQRSTTPLVLTEGGGVTGVSTTGGTGLLLSAGAGNSGFYGTGSGVGGGGVGGVGGLRFGLGRRPIGCDSPLSAAAAAHRNSTNQPTHGGCSGSAGAGLSTTPSAQHRTSSSSTASSSLSSSSSLARLGGGVGGTTGSPSLDVCSSSSLVTNMDVSRSVSPPAKMFHCAVSPRRRQPRHHQQHQRLQRPHRPCLDFDKMQQLKARSVTTWRHSNEHSGELSVFCW